MDRELVARERKSQEATPDAVGQDRPRPRPRIRKGIMNYLRILGRPVGESHHKTFEFTSRSAVEIALTASNSDVTIITHEFPEVRVTLTWFGINTEWIGDTIDVAFDSESSRLSIDTESIVPMPPLDFEAKAPVFGFLRGPKKDGGGRGAFMYASNVDVEIVVPHHAKIESTTTSGDLALVGQFSSVIAQATSGDIRLAADHVSEPISFARLQTTSGDIKIQANILDATAIAHSGDVALGSVGNADVSTTSGDIELNVVKTARLSSVRCKAKSGDVVVRVARGLSVALDVATKSGEISNAIPLDGDTSGEMGVPETDVEISILTSSGDVRIKKSVL